MRLGSPTIVDSSPAKLLREINSAIEVQAAIRIDVNIQRFEIGRCVDQSDVPSLHEVVSYHDVFLVRCDFDVMWADGRLHGVWIIETFDVV